MKNAERHTLKSENHFLKSGRSRMVAFDFKGNPLESLKTFAKDYKNTLNWSGSPTLESESFTETFIYDALDRPTQQTKADGSICQYTYNEAGLLETVKVKAAHEASFFTQVSNINYNEKGQRTDIYYGNNSKTKYTYDPNSFRLTRLLTSRNNGADILQDLNYTYDPVGNITEQSDDAQQTHYFNNTVIEPKGKYTYDSLYRLLKGSGREKTGISAPSPGGLSPDMIPTNGQSGSTLSTYCQQFTYDAMGNLLQLSHRSSCGGAEQWKRTYLYNAGMPNNYLQKAYIGATPPTNPEFTYDAHGNMLQMPHLSSMEWDEYNQLQATHKTNESTYYVYSGGERVRKVVVDTSGATDKIKYERLYLGGFEIYRDYDASENLKTERKTLHVLDDKRIVSLLEIKTVDNGTAIPIASQSTKTRFQYTNHLDSASLELNENAEIISYEEYHSFGTTSYNLHTNDSEVSLKRYRYVHKERDEETGLYYYGARYYAPWLCRFVSVDPLKDKYPFYSTYQYAGNKPITFIDLDGLEPGLPDQVKALDEVAKMELEKYYLKTKIKFKKGKPKIDKKTGEVVTKVNTEREENFAKLVDDILALPNAEGKTIFFTTNQQLFKEKIGDKSSQEYGGTIGVGTDGNYYVFWDPKQTERQGASGIFEEVYHLKDAVEGIELNFAQGSNGTWGTEFLDLNDEGRAKLWVAQNINAVQTNYIDLVEGVEGQGFKPFTHYGYIRSELSSISEVSNFLITGKSEELGSSYLNSNTSGGSFGGYRNTFKIPVAGPKTKYANENRFPRNIDKRNVH